MGAAHRRKFPSFIPALKGRTIFLSPVDESKNIFCPFRAFVINTGWFSQVFTLCFGILPLQGLDIDLFYSPSQTCLLVDPSMKFNHQPKVN